MIGAESEAGVVGAYAAGVVEVLHVGGRGGVDDLAVLLQPVRVLAGDEHQLVMSRDGLADLAGIIEFDAGGAIAVDCEGVEDLLVAAGGGDAGRGEAGFLQFGRQQPAEGAGPAEDVDGHGSFS